jgi:glycosyltransferase involved in cell wall biosynthesis
MLSIVIPTREQPETLRSALAATLAQDIDNFEVIVQDNCSSPDTADVVSAFASERVRYQRSDRVLSMNENWEQGLALTKGSYVTFVGDDCALMPDACRVYTYLILNNQVDIISWAPHKYWWPDAVEESRRGRLMVFCGPLRYISRIIASEDILNFLYKFKISHQDLPMISNSFVSRKVINAVKENSGRYFGGSVPDFYSGIANCWASKQFLYFYRPLSILGVSGHNLTAAYAFADEGGEEIRRQYEQENFVKHRAAPLSLGSFFAGSSILRLAESMAYAIDDFSPGGFHYRLNPMTVLDQVLAEAAQTEVLYDAHIAAAKEIAARSGFSLDNSTLPPRPLQHRQSKVLNSGITLKKNGDIDQLIIDTRKTGVSDILSASRLAQAYMSII